MICRGYAMWSVREERCGDGIIIDQNSNLVVSTSDWSAPLLRVARTRLTSRAKEVVWTVHAVTVDCGFGDEWSLQPRLILTQSDLAGRRHHNQRYHSPYVITRWTWNDVSVYPRYLTSLSRSDKRYLMSNNFYRASLFRGDFALAFICQLAPLRIPTLRDVHCDEFLLFTHDP